MTANKPETVLYRAPTFSLLASHGRISTLEKKEEGDKKEEKEAEGTRRWWKNRKKSRCTEETPHTHTSFLAAPRGRSVGNEDGPRTQPSAVALPLSAAQSHAAQSQRACVDQRSPPPAKRHGYCWAESASSVGGRPWSV